MSTIAGFDLEFLRRIERLALVARRSFRGGAHGQRRARTHGASTDFRDHRAYASGDDLRHLDWNLYARHDRLHVKRHHDEQDVTLHLALDASQSMAFGTPAKSRTVKQLAAALGWMALTEQDRVVVHALGGSAPHALPPLWGRSSARRMLEWLSALEPKGTVRLDEALETVAKSARRPGMVVVVSDFLTEGASAGLERLAAGRHQVHAMQVLAPEERDPRVDGDVRLIDCETETDVVISVSPRLRRIYLETLGQLDAELAATCGRIGATLTRTLSTDAIEDIVFRRLKAQGVLA